mmetsp:Transcript_55122/g.165124  ORF Transcript_55122/g.165124 Transcript_55122/m.165124 type:complete len:302 (+) Transcript_55122:1321-2226(+)
MLGPSLQQVRPHSTEIGIVVPGGLMIQFVQYRNDVIPILHEQHVRTEEEGYFDGGEKVSIVASPPRTSSFVVVFVASVILGQCHLEPQRRGEYDVAPIKLRIQLDRNLTPGILIVHPPPPPPCLPSDLKRHSHLELVVVVRVVAEQLLPFVPLGVQYALSPGLEFVLDGSTAGIDRVIGHESIPILHAGGRRRRRRSGRGGGRSGFVPEEGEHASDEIEARSAGREEYEDRGTGVPLIAPPFLVLLLVVIPPFPAIFLLLLLLLLAASAAPLFSVAVVVVFLLLLLLLLVVVRLSLLLPSR